MKKSKNKVVKDFNFGHKIPCPIFKNGDKCLQKVHFTRRCCKNTQIQNSNAP